MTIVTDGFGKGKLLVTEGYGKGIPFLNEIGDRIVAALRIGTPRIVGDALSDRGRR